MKKNNKISGNVRFGIFNYLIKSILVVLFLATYQSYSIMNTVVLLKGNLISDGNDTNIGAEIEFLDNHGKSVKTKANSFDGTFDIVLSPGVTYKVFIKGYLILNSNTINVPNSTKYIEINETFKLKKLVNDMVLEEMILFKPNSNQVDPAEITKLKNLKEFARKHNIFRLKVIVSTKDSYFQDSVIYDKPMKNKNKKAKILQTIKANDLAHKLLDDRIQELKVILQENSFIEREIEMSSELIVNIISKKENKTKIKEQSSSLDKIGDYSDNKFNLTFLIKRIIN